jgi:hypothetical protein
LSLIPQVAFRVSGGRPFRGLPRFGAYRRSHSRCEVFSRLPVTGSLRGSGIGFLRPGCDTGRIRRSISRPFSTDSLPPRWLTVATYGLPTDCVRSTTPNRGRSCVTRLRDWFLPTAPLFSASQPAVANRLASHSLVREVTTPPGEAGDICLPSTPQAAHFSRGRERQFIPTISPGRESPGLIREAHRIAHSQF